MANMNYFYLLLLIIGGIVILLSWFYTSGVLFVDFTASHTRQNASVQRFTTNSLPEMDYYKQFYVCNHDIISCGWLSSVQLLNNKSRYTIGEMVELKIVVFDQVHRYAMEGGDILRIRSENLKIGASSAGSVIDNGNGTYTGYIKLLWAGQTNILVMLAVTKEQIGVFLRKVNFNGVARSTQASHSKDARHYNVKRKKFCGDVSVYPSNLDSCNYTLSNLGMPWYCEQQSSNLPFGNWEYYTEYINKSYEASLIRVYGYKKLRQIIAVHVINERDRLPGQTISCRNRPPKETWHEQIPTGYFFKNKLYSLYCQNELARNRNTYINCLQHRPIQFYGDSTSRQWFDFLHNYLNLTFQIGEPHGTMEIAWHTYAYSVRKDVNISMSWIPHGMPFFGHANASVLKIPSIGWYLDQLPQNSNAIIILHWYIHIGMTDASMYREHIQIAAIAVRKLLKRSPNTKILIQGPHAFRETRVTFPVDFVKQYLQQMIYEEFQDLKDKVVYLDQWDMTVSVDNYYIRPQERIIKEMVHLMLSYVCNDVN